MHILTAHKCENFRFTATVTRGRVGERERESGRCWYLVECEITWEIRMVKQINDSQPPR